MKAIQQTALLLAGALTVSSPLFAKNGADDAGTSGTSGLAGSAGTSSTTGTAGTAGTSGTSGTTGTSGTASTTGTSGTSGTTGTSGTAGSFGSANLNQKVQANFVNQLLIVPCIDVKNSLFDGHYHVAFGLSGDNSGNDWSIKEVKNANSGSCGSSNANTKDLLQTIGLSSASSSGSAGTSGSSGHNRKVIADFSEKLLVMPCVDVRNTGFKGYYHVVMQLAGDNSGGSWKLKAVNPASASVCEYNESEDVDDDRLLQANGLSSVNALNHR